MKTVQIPKGFDLTCDQEKLDKLKKLFFEEYKKNPDLYDVRDVDHLRNSDLHAIRFLMLGEHNVEAGLEALKHAFKWRKSFGLHDLTEECFPKEFFDLAGLFECGQDRFGFPCVYIRVKTVRKIKIFDHHQMRFLAYMINRIERRFETLQCWTLVFDCTDIGFCNVNLTLIHFLIDLLRNYFPLSVRYAIVLEVPWILNQIQKFVLSLLPDDNKQLIRFVSRKHLSNYVSEDQIPIICGGSSTEDIFRHSPKCGQLDAMAKELYGLEFEETKKLMKPYEYLFKESEILKEQLAKNRELIESLNNNNNNNFDIMIAEECIEVAN